MLNLYPNLTQPWPYFCSHTKASQSIIKLRTATDTKCANEKKNVKADLTYLLKPTRSTNLVAENSDI